MIIIHHPDKGSFPYKANPLRTPSGNPTLLNIPIPQIYKSDGIVQRPLRFPRKGMIGYDFFSHQNNGYHEPQDRFSLVPVATVPLEIEQKPRHLAGQYPSLLHGTRKALEAGFFQLYPLNPAGGEYSNTGNIFSQKD